MATNFYTSSVKELQTFLKDRGIIFSNQKKVDLIELCSAADELGLEIDPDGLIEDMYKFSSLLWLEATGLTFWSSA